MIVIGAGPFSLVNVSSRIRQDSSESATIISHKIVVQLPSEGSGDRVRSCVLDLGEEVNRSGGESSSNDGVSNLDGECLLNSAGLVRVFSIVVLDHGISIFNGSGFIDRQSMPRAIGRADRGQGLVVMVSLHSCLGVNREEDGVRIFINSSPKNFLRSASFGTRVKGSSSSAPESILFVDNNLVPAIAEGVYAREGS